MNCCWINRFIYKDIISRINDHFKHLTKETQVSLENTVSSLRTPPPIFFFFFLELTRVLEWLSLMAQLIKNPLQCRRSLFDSWVRKIPWRRARLPTPVFLGFPCDSAGKESACNRGDLGSIPGLGRSPGAGKGYPLQYSGLENSMDCIVHGVAKSRTRLSSFHFHCQGPRVGVGRFSINARWNVFCGPGVCVAPTHLCLCGESAAIDSMQADGVAEFQ